MNTLPLLACLILVAGLSAISATCVPKDITNTRSMYFDGDTWLNVTDLGSGVYDGLTTFTFSAWIKPTWDWQYTSGRSNVASKWDYNSLVGSWAVDIWPTGVSGVGSNSLVVFIAPSTSDGGNYGFEVKNYVDAGIWQHVAFTFDSGTVNTYKNGNNQANVNFNLNSDSGVNTILHADTNVVIGQFPGLGRNFTGEIDDVALFKVALTDGQITRLYNKGRRAVDIACMNGLQSWYRMGDEDTITATTVTDSGPKGNNGVIYGADSGYPFYAR